MLRGFWAGLPASLTIQSCRNPPHDKAGPGPYSGHMKSITTARLPWIALLLSLGLLCGAWFFEHGLGYAPCQMCYWQRWPHFAALVPALLAFLVKAPGLQRTLVAFAAFAIFTSGVIGAFHAGVEYGWWEGLTSCTTTIASGGNFLENLENAPLVRCDVTQWTLFGISLAGYNFLLSCGGAIAILMGIWRNAKN